MEKERKELALGSLEPNNGQLEWLPKNPRQWTKDDVERTAHSINEDEDFLEDRPLLVVPHGKKYVVFAGNLRREGSVKAGLGKVPCVVYRPQDEGDQLTIKRRSIKDNGAFGSWDFDELANFWDDLPIADWGAPAWEGTEEGPGEGRGPTPAADDFEYKQQFGVIVTCKDELEQKAVYERLVGEGFECRVVSV